VLWRQEAGGRRQEAGGRRQEAVGRRQESWCGTVESKNWIIYFLEFPQNLWKILT